MSSNIQRFIRKGILDLDEYIPGKPIEELQREYGLRDIIKMASNENPLGTSPQAIEAIKKNLTTLNLYPEPLCSSLKKKMASHLGIHQGMITFANGADNILLMIAQAFINERDEALMADLTFPVYKNAVKVMGGIPVLVPLREYAHDLKAMIRAVTSRTKLLFICNPNNPTGTINTAKDLDLFFDQIPDHILVILDEVYKDFPSDPQFPDGIDYVRKGHNLICVRSFSKIYGLAGLRIGYALTNPDLTKALERVREIYCVNKIAQIAAEAALEDEEFRDKTLNMTNIGKKFLYSEFEKMGMDYVQSHTNFIFVDLKGDSREVYQALLPEGIIIRPGYIWDLPTFARITIGTMEQNKRLVLALKKALSC